MAHSPTGNLLNASEAGVGAAAAVCENQFARADNKVAKASGNTPAKPTVATDAEGRKAALKVATAKAEDDCWKLVSQLGIPGLPAPGLASCDASCKDPYGSLSYSIKIDETKTMYTTFGANHRFLADIQYTCSAARVCTPKPVSPGKGVEGGDAATDVNQIAQPL